MIVDLTMAQIDPTARVAETARLADDVEIGPFCVVGPQVELAAGVRLVSHVSVTASHGSARARSFHPFARSAARRSRSPYRGEPTQLVVGAIARSTKASR